MGSRLLTVITRLKPFTICGRHAVASTTTTTTTPTVRGFTSTARSLVQQDRNDAFGLEEKEWQFDDISSAGHDELEQHREAREYARIAAYEMPLLHRYAQPFEPPTKSQTLRFRYTTYMGDKHPAEPKVVMEFTVADLNLSPVSSRKLIKLVGPRYNPVKGLVKLSCEMFETQAQNKRYLGDLLDKLLAEANDLTDDFEDIPLDFRRHKKKMKIKPKFPVDWRMPKEKRMAFIQARVQQLESSR